MKQIGAITGWSLLVLTSCGVLVSCSGKETGEAEEQPVTAVEKTAFLELVAQLPTKGEFFTEEAIKKASPQTRVLFALTVNDLQGRDIYPFLALSRGLCDFKEWREYGVKNFAKIAHSEIKLGWAVVLFSEKAASPEIVKFLKAVLDSKERSEELARMVGPNFEDFKKRVKDHSDN